MRGTPLLRICLFVMLGLVGCGLSACQSPSTQAQEAVNEELKTRERNQLRSAELFRKGVTAAETMQNNDALGYFKQATEVDSRNTEAWVALGIAYYKKNKLYEAAEAFHTAARLAPEAYEPHFNLGAVLEMGRQYRKAIAEYDAALKLSPDNIQIMENLARCLLSLHEDPDRANAMIQRALFNEDRGEWRVWLKKKALELSLDQSSSTTAPTTQSSKR